MTKEKFQSHGFTLLEIIVSVGIISLIAVVVTQVLFSTGQSNSKAEIQKEVKQNGNYALGVIDRMMRNAQSVTSTCDGSITTSIQITNPDNGATTFGCVLDSGVTRLASQSASGTKYLTNDSVTLGGVNCAASTLQFTCSTSTNIPARIKVMFSLSQQGTPVSQFEQASAEFQTTIGLRN